MREHWQQPHTYEKAPACITTVVPGSEQFALLKQDMGISDRYEATLTELAMQGKAVVFAAVEDDRYVGRVTLRHDWTERLEIDEPSVRIEDEYPGLPQINALEVAEQYRGRGIASQLLAAAENEACQQGFDQVGLAVDVTNKRAMGIYEKRGYMYRLVADGPTFTSVYHRTDGTDEAGEYYLMTKQVRGKG